MEYFTIFFGLNAIVYLWLIAWRLNDIKEELKKINKNKQDMEKLDRFEWRDKYIRVVGRQTLMYNNCLEVNEEDIERIYSKYKNK